ncbi:putative phosphoprotein phosphatase [Trypanosoma theileri]|uniref:Putative phosphoprotein phosphatase n=1 Tax=Trypanosoma theileri TaxID=67003 RepID=A0A1X0NJI7_9TRYP|nr:putative phosphoprotein phosphatase [Trypanosoma theileri]ORC84905.1 putative phosphoprotein phosphatase [Trypanosoma theileri]
MTAKYPVPEKEVVNSVPESMNGAKGIMSDIGDGVMGEDAVNLLPLKNHTDTDEKVLLCDAKKNGDPCDLGGEVETETAVERVVRADASTLAEAECEGSPLGVSSTVISTNYTSFFSTPPSKGIFIDLIDTFMQAGITAFTLSDNDKADGDVTGGANSSWNEKIRRFLTIDVVDRLCHEVRTVLEEESTLLDINVSSDETLVVVGDIHGHLSDMFRHVLSQQFDRRMNVSGVDRKFLFLGDYVDRGPCGVEVVMLLLALKVEYPQLVYMTRGNHEVPHTSRIYGFYSEVQLKFGGDAAWVRFNEVFCFLPLAAVVSTPTRRFFAVHGGLSPPLAQSTVDLITGIERCDYGSALDNVFSDVVDGLLWSDPGDTSTPYSRNVRGCGYIFGDNASRDFCERNNFDFICRAHQVVSDGYAWTHNDRVLTVFSVPNYCGFNNNLGAIMIVQPSTTDVATAPEVGDDNDGDYDNNDKGKNTIKVHDDDDDDDHNGGHDDEGGKNNNEGDNDNRNRCNGNRDYGDLRFIQFASTSERSPPSIPSLFLAPLPKPCGDFVFAEFTE